jgi:menaquinone reductase, molybdopterin-binding-like subunit
MKLSRRCFLSFVIGGAAGTALSPLPWKLTDDLSIWSQNWPWTPVPEDGEATYVNSTCTLCPGGCGINIRKINDRAVKIEGLEGHPINDGGLCMLGLSGLQLLYGPTRVKAPLKRSGKRGEGQWQTISWQQAIEEVAHKLNEIRDQGNPQSVACIAARDTGTVPQLLNRLLGAYGSPNFYRMPSMEDAYEAALYLMQGADGFAGLDVENADFILSFGSAILEGYGSPVRMIQAHSQWKERNATLVQIEPRLSNTAARADQWLPINPGTETEMALAMAHVIITQNLIRNGSGDIQGLDAFARMVKEKYAPQTVAGLIGVDAQKIADLARRFAAANKPLALYGCGKGQTPGSLKEALAVHALNALVGNINQSGGVLALPAYDYIDWPEIQTDDVAAAGLQETRLDGAGSEQYPHARYLVHRLINTIHEKPDAVQALLVAEANPCYSLPDTARVKAAFDKVPFVVSFSSYMDETAMQADLILPNHLYLERYEDVPVTAGIRQPLIGLCQPAVKPLYNTQHLGDTVIQIAQAMEGGIAEAFAWENYDHCLQETLADQWDTLTEKAFLTGRVAGDLSAQVVLMNDALGAVYMADSVDPEGDAGSYPLLLVPYDSMRLASRDVAATPFMIKTVSDTILKAMDGFVEINPQTAATLGITEGQPALLTTPKGEARVRVHLYEGVAPRLIAMPRGLGHANPDRFLAGKGTNVNQLIGPMEDPASGLYAAWGIRAKLAKA